MKKTTWQRGEKNLRGTAINFGSMSLAGKLTPRGKGRTPTYLKTWMTGKIGSNLIWKQGASAGAMALVGNGVYKDRKGVPQQPSYAAAKSDLYWSAA